MDVAAPVHSRMPIVAQQLYDLLQITQGHFRLSTRNLWQAGSSRILAPKNARATDV
jgi:hypothetical protein